MTFTQAAAPVSHQIGPDGAAHDRSVGDVPSADTPQAEPQVRRWPWPAPLALLAAGVPAAAISAWSWIGATLPTAADASIQAKDSYFYFVYQPLPGPGTRLALTIGGTLALIVVVAAALRGLATSRLDRGWGLVLLAAGAASAVAGSVLRILIMPTLDGIEGAMAVVGGLPAIAILSLFVLWRSVVLTRGALRSPGT